MHFLDVRFTDSSAALSFYRVEAPAEDMVPADRRGVRAT
jgi:hypothetical protein